MSSWRDDPELIRQDDEDLTQHVEVEERWERLFQMVEVMFTGEGGGVAKGTFRAVFRGFLHQAKKRVAVDPDGSRAYVVESMQAIAACLQVEPLELYPDLKKKPAVA